jgi:hypothetical protein
MSLKNQTYFMKKAFFRAFIRNIALACIFCLAFGTSGLAQKTSEKSSTAKDSLLRPYFIITAGETITAFFKDKPLNLETITEFTDWVQANAKMLKNARVVVTGKPKTGTYDELLRTLSRYHIKDVSKNVLN